MNRYICGEHGQLHARGCPCCSLCYRKSASEPFGESIAHTITIGITGEDWEPTDATQYFAQMDDGAYTFGETPEEALEAL